MSMKPLRVLEMHGYGGSVSDEQTGQQYLSMDDYWVTMSVEDNTLMYIDGNKIYFRSLLDDGEDPYETTKQLPAEVIVKMSPNQWVNVNDQQKGSR